MAEGVTTEAAPRLPDLDLAGLRSFVPGLELTVGDHVRLTAYLTTLIDGGWTPGSRAELGPLLAPLLARSVEDQEAIHAFYAERPPALAAAERDDGGEDVGLAKSGGAAGGDRRWSLAVAALSVAAIVAAVVWMMSGGGGSGGGTGVTGPAVTTPQSDLAGLAGWLVWLPDVTARLLTGEAVLRLLLVAVPLGITIRILLAIADRRATLDPEAANEARDATQVGLPPSVRYGLLSGPATLQDFARLHLQRSRPTRRIDVRRSVESLARAADGNVRLVHAVDRRSVAHLVLIDRRNPRDHLGELGDLVVTRLRDAGVPVQSFDMLADPGRVTSRVAALTPDVPVIGSVALADQFRLDALLVVAEAGRLLDPARRHLADWLEPYGERAMIAVMTPRPRPAWGHDERRLAMLGIAVFPISAEGCADYVAYRRASLGERPLAPPVGGGPAAIWTIEDAIDAIAAVDAKAVHGDDDEQEAVFALRAALSPRAYALLSVLAIFPVLVPELTLRMRRVLPEGGGQDTAVLAELATLPAFRSGRLPLWLRKRLLAEVPDDRRERARQEIAHFQDDVVPGGVAFASLGITTEAEGVFRFLSILSPRAAKATARDALFLRFMRKDRIGDLNVEVTNDLRDLLDRGTRRNLAVVAAAGLAVAVMTWFLAPTLIESGLAALGAAGGLLVPLAARENPVLAVLLHVLPLALWAWANSSRLLDAAATSASPATAWRAGVVRRLLPVLPALALVIGNAAILALDRGIGNQPAVAHVDWDLAMYSLTVSLFVLVLVMGRRLATPFDPVGFAVARGAGQVTAGFVCVVAANVAVVTFLFYLYLAEPALREARLCGMLGAILLLLAALLLRSGQGPWRNHTYAMLDMIVALVPVGMVLSVLVILMLLLDFQGSRLAWIPLASASLALFLPILFRAGLVSWWEWAALSVPAAIVFAVDWTGINDIADRMGTLPMIVSGVAPALAVLVLGELVFRRHHDRRQYWRRGALLLLVLAALTGGPAATGLAPGFAQELPATPACDPAKNPACPTPPVGQAPPSVPEGEPVMDPQVMADLGGPADLVPYVGFLSLYLSAAFVLGHWLWLRRRALDRGQAPVWDEGRMGILLAVPFLLLTGIGIRMDDSTFLSLLYFYPVVAAGLAWWCGFWGAAAAIAGILPMVGQTGIAAGTLIGGAGIGMILTVALIVRMVAERGFLARLLAIDTITPAQYAVMALLAFPLVGYAIPEIALRVELASGVLYWLALFVVGLSRVRLGRPALFAVALWAIWYGIGQLAPVAPNPAGIYAGVRSSGLAETFSGLGWTLVVMAVARGLRQRFVADLGSDAAAHDGAVMAALAQVFGNRWLLVAVAFWTALAAKVGVGASEFGPDAIGLFVAFAAGMQMWAWQVRFGSGEPVRAPVGTIAVAMLAGFLIATEAVGTVLPTNSAFDLFPFGIRSTQGMVPRTWSLLVAAYLCLGYLSAMWSAGLRRPAILSRDLWSTARPVAAKEAPVA